MSETITYQIIAPLLAGLVLGHLLLSVPLPRKGLRIWVALAKVR